MKNKLTIVLAILLCLLAFVSCELGFSVDKPTIYVLSWGNEYKGGVSINDCKYQNFGDTACTRTISGKSGSFGYLKCTINDANDVTAAFELLAKKAGYKCTTSTILLETTNRTEGHYDNYITKLNNFTASMKDSDILICYFSGHGQIGSKIGLEKSYLVFSDQLIDYDIVKYDISSKKGTKLIICDSCYSGAFIPTDNGVTINPDVSNKNPIKILFKSQIRENAQMFILSASRWSETSDDGSDGNSNSVFTASLLKALGGGRGQTSLGTIGALKNNKLTVSGIAKYVYDDMGEKKAHHIPVLSGRNDDLILFKF